MNNLFAKFTFYTLVLFSFLVTMRMKVWGANFFWDLNVYVRAVDDYVHGGNPYRVDVDLVFVYPPIVLMALAFINEFIKIKFFFYGFYFISTVLFLYEFNNFLIKNKLNQCLQQPIYFPYLSALSFGGVGFVSLLTGNLTLFVHFFLVSLFLKIYRNKFYYNYIFFIIGVVIASNIKPYLLAYLLLLYPSLGFIKSTFISLLALIAFFGVFLLNLINPIAFDEFLFGLSFQSIEKGDLGFSMFGLIDDYLNVGAALAAHFVIVLLLATLIFQLAYFRIQDQFRSRLFICFLVVIIIIINPRMKEYDFVIALLFLYATRYFYNAPLNLYKFNIGLFISLFPMICKSFDAIFKTNTSMHLISNHYFMAIGFYFMLLLILNETWIQSRSATRFKDS